MNFWRLLMKKTKKVIIAMVVLAIVITSFGGVFGLLKKDNQVVNDGKVQFASEVADATNRLTVPFDLAYEESFNEGAYAYNENAVLLKMDASFDGNFRNEFSECGFELIERISKNANNEYWFKATLKNGASVHDAIKSARELEIVKMADYDYIYETEVVDADSLIDDVLENLQALEQWYLKSCGIQDAWKFLQSNGISAGGSNSVVVAVIDTGVDYNHPDLVANMWTNSGEIPNDGVDNDGNGYIDDYYGWNATANNGNPMDDNGHGTHVAGIVGAANNKEGIVGVAYNCKIMAVKAGQATGVFTNADIAEAIMYAYEMGADVINMSFGGSAISIAVQDALDSAYTTATLVASAGNNGKPNEATDYYPPSPSYPAALSYVIGVTSVNYLDVESAFTNWDAEKFNSVEYEVAAPGEQILSTLPNGQYGKLSGTSMAAPVVSGVAALLRSYYADRDMYPSKFIAGQLSATSEDKSICCDPEDHAVGGNAHNLPMVVNAYDAFTKLPKPEVNFYDYYLFDDISFSETNTADGVVDSGETIAIGLVLQNRWGMSKDTIVTIDAKVGSAGLSNPYVEIIQDNVNFDSIGTYSKKDQLLRDGSIITGIENPLIIKIADDCPNDYLIQINVNVSCKNALDEHDATVYETSGSFDFVVRNGVVLPSQITEDMTLTKDNYYIIPNATYIASTATVTVEPGTKIQFWTDDPEDPYADTYIAYLNVAGKFICNGTIDEQIEMFPSAFMDKFCVEIKETLTGFVELNYCSISNPVIKADVVNYCNFYLNANEIYCKKISIYDNKINFLKCKPEVYGLLIENSIFNSIDVDVDSYYLKLNNHLNRCVFINSKVDTTHAVLTNCVFYGNDKYVNSFENNKVYSFVGCDQNQETNTTYISILNQYFSSNNQMMEIFNIRKFAEFLGGHFAYVETVEELNWLKDKRVFGYIDLVKGSKIWPNGESLNIDVVVEGDSIIPTIIDDSNSNLKYKDTRYILWFIIEIPSLVDIDKDNFNKLYTEWVQTKTHTFTQNAILNNFNDTNLENWFKLTGADGYVEGESINLSNNWWGTTDEEMINKQIVDFDDYNTLQDIDPSGYLTTPPSDTFPFVTDAYLLNADGERVATVSNETVTFVINFNRAMDTSVPLRVRFGSSEPFAEYEIAGEFVSETQWRGTYTLKTTIENGFQTIRVENGRAKDDHYLILLDSPGRFMFEIDTSSAQALIMQGEATDIGINLSWTQDDFDTLAGYNVYRSTKEDGLYQKLNTTVIPAAVKTWFDSTVEPGVVYYYNFTVVQTDLSESTPSGKIVIMSKDTMAPNIYHSPVRTAYTNSNLIINATITDNLAITSAKIFFRTVGASDWQSIDMRASNSKYSAVIASDKLSTDGLEYYIQAFDGITHTYKGSAESPYLVTVKLAVDANALGDVDGDGIITTKDALMLLQATNDLLNLTEEQFLRADINKDGELSAAEALRILQYVSGKITTIVG